MMLKVMIGYYTHQCSCVRYLSHESHDNTALIVGLSVGLAVLLVIIVIIIIISVVCCRDRTRQAPQQVSEDNAGAAFELHDKDSASYGRHLPHDYRETGMDPGKDVRYSRRLSDDGLDYPD